MFSGNETIDVKIFEERIACIIRRLMTKIKCHIRKINVNLYK